jgi:hypothetical protein
MLKILKGKKGKMPIYRPRPNYDYKFEDLAWIPEFILEVKDYFFPRPEDNLLILRPNKVMNLNETAMLMLQLLFEGMSVEEVTEHFTKLGADRQVVLNDLAAFVEDLRNMVSGNQNIYAYKTAKIVPFGTGEIKFPVLSEIALTYRCNNACRFCYAYSPYRESKEMSTVEVKRIMQRHRVSPLQEENQRFVRTCLNSSPTAGRRASEST